MSKLYLFFCGVLVIFVGASCNKNKSLFEQLPSSETGITFTNRILESDSFNILTYQYIYNGGGVAVSDFNNDGLQDIYFTANMVENELYLNQGDLKFKNVTKTANVAGEGKWNSGVAVVDINNDGWNDIYVAATTHHDPERRANTLYINQGVNDENIPVFKNMAVEYNLADTSYTHNVAFFDYDNDGDLDVYLVVNRFNEYSSMNMYHKKMIKGESETTDRLYRNEGSDSLGHPYFTEVGREAGILIEGFGLGINISDLNQDGWKDVYITNDFVTNDVIYVNNGDGTFTDKASDYLKHTAHSAMGNDIADVNNDGHLDIVALDMLPEDNYRKKMMLLPNNYNVYLSNEKYGYDYQYVRNQLHLYRGDHPETGDPVFSDVSMLAGISATDWSWTPLICDFDNDGLRDMIITNGFPKDITDHDFSDYQARHMAYAPVEMMLREIPSVKISNYAFRNQDGVKFEDVTNEWGMKIPSFSNGAVQVDLDNDGDLDCVMNNINHSAFVFRNNQVELNPESNHFLRIKLKGSDLNPMGLGTLLEIEYGDNRRQYYEHTIYRGYLSSVEPVAHFGLNDSDTVDKVTVIWPDSSIQVLHNVPSNQVLTLDIDDASEKGNAELDESPERAPFFRDITNASKINFVHQEKDFIDFKIQPLLPHKLSQYGPGLAVGDANRDGLEDVYISGSFGYKGAFLIQQPDGTFAKDNLLSGNDSENKEEELGSLFFDADGDGDDDLYIVSGSYEHKPGSKAFQDRLFINENGKFHLVETALPEFLSSGSCVKAADYDKDGDLDLFVGGRVSPYEYPKPVSSYILENVSQSGDVKFVIANQRIAPILNKIGMISDALWTDFNNDGWTDLILAGEWMSLRFLKNEAGKLVDITNSTGIDNYKGWWNSLCPADFDRDGDIDYVAGNLGMNTFFNASEEYPVRIYANDFDNNGRYDAVPTVYFKNREDNKIEVPYHVKQDLGEQMWVINQKFETHKAFATSDINGILSKLDTTGTLTYEANYMKTSYVENLGDGKFKVTPLSDKVQWAPVYGMIAEDVNRDGHTDVIVVGNDYGTEIAMGRYDAMNGLVMMGNGDGSFEIVNFEESGFFVPGDAKALVSFVDNNNDFIVMASQNRGELKCYKNGGMSAPIPVQPQDAYAVVHLQDGSFYKEEFYYGSGFLSQSARYLVPPKDYSKIEISDFQGNMRTVETSALSNLPFGNRLGE